MRKHGRLVLFALACTSAAWAGPIQEQNKALARRFYEQVWFSNHPQVVDEIFAPTYVVHDVGKRTDLREQANKQKEIAGSFWSKGTMAGRIQFQVAEGDLVVTRWLWTFHPRVWWMRAIGGDIAIPIINVMRFENGRVVEIWNHRYDFDAAKQFGVFRILFALGVLSGLAMWGVVALGRFAWRRLRPA